MAHVLIVDDEQNFVSATAEVLRLHGHTVSTADALNTARLVLKERIPQHLLLDLILPDGNGLELLDELETRMPENVVIMTGHPSIKSAIAEVTGPGVSYLTKPFKAHDLLAALNAKQVAQDTQGHRHFGLMIGDSPAMQALYRKIRQVAPTDSTVLIQGESGTGKELVAEAIHRNSDRSGRFVPVNCGGMSNGLLNSELFGHEKGSFTGANRRHAGFFERADTGTLFLDEITEMPLTMQSHLLRTLETGRILPVGGEAERAVNARLIAATNRQPVEAIGEKLLREDLYFRLRVFPIEVPPLRERLADIDPLARNFLKELNEKYNTRKRFFRDTLERLRAHDWPGNVRELKHAVHQAYIMADGGNAEIALPEHFDVGVGKAGKHTALSVGRSISDVEKELILSTLAHFEGDKRAAASTLGISLKTLYNRLNEYERHN